MLGRCPRYSAALQFKQLLAFLPFNTENITFITSAWEPYACIYILDYDWCSHWIPTP